MPRVVRKRAKKVNDVLSTKGHRFLERCGRSWGGLGTFSFGPLHENGDVPRFHFRMELPKTEGGRQRISRRDPTDLAILLRESKKAPRMSVWFWVAQLVHYSLYDPWIRDDSKKKMARRCMKILREKLRQGNLTVPATIRQREEKTRANHAERVNKKNKETKEVAARHAKRIDTALQEPLNVAQHESNDDTSSDAGSSDDSSTDNSSSEDDDGESCHPTDDGSQTACESAARIHVRDDEEDGDDHNDDNGDTSSLDDPPLRHRVRPEATDSTYRTEEDEDDELMADCEPDFREDGSFSNAEIRILHKWRDRFCVEYNMTRADFQVMMTRSTCRGNKEWTCNFITKATFIERYREQLPVRDRGSMLRLRGRHRWDPPNEPKLVKKVRKPASTQKCRRSRLSVIEGDNEEDIDSGELAMLNAREAPEDADIWELRATEELSDDDSGNQEIASDRQGKRGTRESRVTRIDNQRSDVRNKQKQREETTDLDVHVVDVIPVVTEDSKFAALKLQEHEICYDNTPSGRPTAHINVREAVVQEPRVASLFDRRDRSLSYTTSTPAQARNTTTSSVQSDMPQITHKDTRPSYSAVRRESTSVSDRKKNSRVAASLVQRSHEDRISIPSSSPQSMLLERLPKSVSAKPTEAIPKSPVQITSRDQSSPLLPQSSRPQVEYLTNAQHNAPVESIKNSTQSNPLQAIKRIAGNYGILFTQLSQIDQEEQLDDFVDYVSKYVQKPSRASFSNGLENVRTEHIVQGTRSSTTEHQRSHLKRPRSPENNSDDTSHKQIAENLSRSQVGNQEARNPLKQNSRNMKRSKGISAGPDGWKNVSNGQAEAASPSTITGRASSVQIPIRSSLGGLVRSASHPGTPSDSQPGTPHERQSKQRISRPGHVSSALPDTSIRSANAAISLPAHDPMQQQHSPTYSPTTSSTVITPMQNLENVDARSSRPRREASFEFPVPILIRSGSSSRVLVSDQDFSTTKVAKHPNPFGTALVDRDKPYGSQENPHVIPSTPKSVRTVDLAVKDEPRNDSVLPVQASRQKDLSKGTDTGRIKKYESPLPGGITPDPVRSSSTFGNPTPPSIINQGISRVADLRLGQSYSESPSFSDVMRQDDRLYRRNQPKAVRNPTRDPRVQALVAHAQLDDHNLAALDSDHGKGKENSRTKRFQTEVLSWQPQKHCPIPSVEQSDDDMWYQGSQSISNKVESQHNDSHLASGSTSRKTRYNLGIPSVFQNKASK